MKFTMECTKSAITVGTGDEVERIIRQVNQAEDLAVATNLEFLQGGAVINQSKRLDRIEPAPVCLTSPTPRIPTPWSAAPKPSSSPQNGTPSARSISIDGRSKLQSVAPTICATPIVRRTF